jgi:hypothetical protein
MLIDDVERYLALRRSLGFKLDKVAANLRAFAGFATSKGRYARHRGDRRRVGGDDTHAKAVQLPARLYGAACKLPSCRRPRP